MSYSMTHLIIADRFAKEKNILNRDIFLLAGIAPDAVHSRKDFTFELKARAHRLQENEKWGQIWTSEAMNTWYERIGEFYKKSIQHAENDKEFDFLKGYTLHALVDDFNCKLVYGPQLAKFNYRSENMIDEYRRECVGQDNYLYQTYGDTRKIVEALDRALRSDITDTLLQHLGLDGYISAEDLSKSVETFKNTHSTAKKAEMNGYTMMSEQSTWDFLDEVFNEANRLLYTFPTQKDVTP